jgi:hypothetical protein
MLLTHSIRHLEIVVASISLLKGVKGSAHAHRLVAEGLHLSQLLFKVDSCSALRCKE